MAPDLDDTIVVRLKRSALEDPAFPLGIVRLSPERRITYMNRAAREMAGPAANEGDLLSELPVDEEGKSALDAAMQDRDQGKGTTYRLGMFRSDLQRISYGTVSAMPEYDEAGNVTGSVGFIVEQDLKDVTLRIHQAVEKCETSESLYKALDHELRGVIAFDTMMVTGISSDRNHLQALFESPGQTVYSVPTKWWPMQPFIRKMIEPFHPGELDLEEMFARPEFVEYARTDEDFRNFKDEKYRHALRIGVTDSGKLRAIISLLRKSESPFSEGEVRRCMQLPVSEAGTAALALDREQRLELRLRLIRQVAEGAEDIPRVSRLLVEELKNHYGWAHVSLFQVDLDGELLRLVCQAGEKEHRLREGYTQKVTEGLLGRSFQHDKIINIGDVKTSALAHGYVQGIPTTVSEMIVPLSVPGSRLRWLLNVESPLRAAFSEEDQTDLKLLLQVVGLILDRAATMDLKAKIVDAVADGVIITSSAGIVQEINPAALRMLGNRRPEEVRERPLSGFFAIPEDEDDANTSALFKLAADMQGSPEEIFVREDCPPMKAQWLLPNRQRHNVRLTSARLPADLGGKVFLAMDLTGQERVRRLESLTEVLHQLATETRVPLALAATFLDEAVASKPKRVAIELIDSALRQIRKANLPLERVLRVEAASLCGELPKAQVDLVSSVNQACEELPSTEASEVVIVHKEAPIHAAAAPPELRFCIQGLLAHLLRVRSQKEKVEVTIGHLRKSPYVGFKLTRDEPGEVDTPAAAEDELKLVEPVLEGLMRRMGGDYKRRGRNLSRFMLTLEEG